MNNMKILFVSQFNGLDYQNDTIYYGLINNSLDVFESSYPRPLIIGNVDPSTLYGKGFTTANKMTHTPKVESNEEIMDKISSNFYDMVIYGSIWRDNSFIEHVTTKYDKKRIHFIDGEDHTNIKEDYVSKGVYWKRELTDSEVNPINFSIPMSQLIKDTPPKQKIMAHIIPGDLSTYIYNDENSYYQDYAISYYGRTWKKGGWDCMRHYEILANKCIPYFPDLHNCPEKTMTYFPKKIILQTNLYAEKNEIHPNYGEISEELFEYTKNNLTSEKLVEKLFLS